MLTLLGGRAAEYSGLARSVQWHVLEYFPQPLDNIIIVDFAIGHP
jgi:hypothetical protein